MRHGKEVGARVKMWPCKEIKSTVETEPRKGTSKSRIAHFLCQVFWYEEEFSDYYTNQGIDKIVEAKIGSLLLEYKEMIGII